MSNQTSNKTAAQIYGDAGLIYLRAPAKIETKENGQKKIKVMKLVVCKDLKKPRIMKVREKSENKALW